MNPTYNYLIIGKGPFGAAAARHLSQVTDKVAIIGPDEPQNWQSHGGVFSSHYDQGRIATMRGPDEIWEQLDQASIVNYRTLEATSGIDFYTPSGILSASPPNHPFSYPYHTEADAITQQFSAKTLPDTYPLNFPDHFNVYVEAPPTGYIDPRAMIQAQLTIAAQQGATLLDGVITAVSPHATHVAVTTAAGSIFKAHKILLATGAFSNCFNLLPQPLALRNKTETTLLAEVAEATAAKLAHLPPINYLIDDPILQHVYLLPPLRYPNGRYYLKLGANTPADALLPDLASLQNWFRAPHNPHQTTMQETLLAIMPNLEVISWELKPCVICYTPHTKPFIDTLIYDQIYVALGGNGGSAHPSDAIGKLAADLMHNGSWSSPITPHHFQLEYAADWQEWLTAPLHHPATARVNQE